MRLARVCVSALFGLAGCASGGRSEAETGTEAPAFEARGQEPGWIAKLRRDGALELLLDYGERRLVTGPARAAAVQDGSAYIAASAAGPVRLLIQFRPCSDAMSGRPYPATVKLETPGRVYEGCGGPPAPPAGS